MGLFGFLKKESLKETYYPEQYPQDPSKRIIGPDNKYDLTRFSRQEDSVIKAAIESTNRKYPDKYRGIGLVNETYGIVYKPRYVLLRIAEIKYTDSNNPLDILAAAFAFGEDGAAHREKAISLFEQSYEKVDKTELLKFDFLFPILFLTKFAGWYEQEHKYNQAIALLKELLMYKVGNQNHFKEKIQELKEKQKNWKPLRRRKIKEDQVLFEQGVTNAAQHYLCLLN